MSNLFNESDLIFSYTRKQAIDDGVLIDVSGTAKEAGFKFPVAVTNRVWGEITPKNELNGQSTMGRLWDMLTVLRFSIKSSKGSDIAFKFLVSGKYLHLNANCGPGDDMEPVITIMLPHED